MKLIPRCSEIFWAACTLCILCGLFNVYWLDAAVSLDANPSQMNGLNKPYCLPFGFVENRGQVGKNIKYYARSGNYSVVVTGNDVVYSLMMINKELPGRKINLKVPLGNANHLTIEGVQELDAVVNVFKGDDPGKWRTGIPVYSALDLGEICAGVCLSLKMTEAGFEKVFTIRPHADPSVIKIELEGVDKLSVDQNGELVCQIGEEALRFTKPVAFQQIDGARIDVPVFYEINDHSYRLSSWNLLS